jgi:phosphomannomutase
VIKLINFELEKIHFEEHGKVNTLKLSNLTEEERLIIDPIVAPTSGLRIQILDSLKEAEGNLRILTRNKLFLFLRVLKAISVKYKQMKDSSDLKVLIVTDDRPTRKLLLNYASQIFSNDGYEIYYQKDESGESRLSSPYGAASVTLLKEINLIIVLTASHNDLSWNGIKFYIDYPIPISGDLFKQISEIAIALREIDFKTDFEAITIDAENINNE